MKKTIIDELFEFTEELTLLIKQDWEKSKKFIKEHKNYFFWILALFVSMQFTDILTLGKSWEIYCKKHNLQIGGSAAAPAPATTPAPAPTPKNAGEAPGPKNAGEAPGPKNAGEAPGPKNAGEAPGPKNEGGNGNKQGTGAGAGGPGPTESGESKTKQRIGKSKSKFSQAIKNNPVFGNLDKIFNMTQGMFALLMFILIIVGVLSLPVIIFIIITYCIVKNLCSRLAIL
jgi:hypothetical protein